MATKNQKALPVNHLIRGGHQQQALAKWCDDIILELAAGGNSNDIIGILRFIPRVKEILSDVITHTEINQIAKDMHNDQSYDFIGETQAIIDNLTTAATQLSALIPKNPAGYILLYSVDESGVLQPRSFTAGQLAPVVAILQTLANSIEQ